MIQETIAIAVDRPTLRGM